MVDRDATADTAPVAPDRIRVRTLPGARQPGTVPRPDRPAHLRAPVAGSAEDLRRRGARFTEGAEPDRPAPVEDPTQLCCAIVQAAVEALRGTRPLAQLVRWVTPEVYEGLSARATLTVRVLGTATTRPTIRRVRLCRLGDRAAEATVVVDDGGRVRAVAIRRDERRGTWRAAALEIGEEPPSPPKARRPAPRQRDGPSVGIDGRPRAAVRPPRSCRGRSCTSCRSRTGTARCAASPGTSGRPTPAQRPPPSPARAPGRRRRCSGPCTAAAPCGPGRRAPSRPACPGRPAGPSPCRTGRRGASSARPRPRGGRGAGGAGRRITASFAAPSVTAVCAAEAAVTTGVGSASAWSSASAPRP